MTLCVLAKLARSLVDILQYTPLTYCDIDDDLCERHTEPRTCGCELIHDALHQLLSSVGGRAFTEDHSSVAGAHYFAAESSVEERPKEGVLTRGRKKL